MYCNILKEVFPHGNKLFHCEFTATSQDETDSEEDDEVIYEDGIASKISEELGQTI
jgi:hypothetical protein